MDLKQIEHFLKLYEEGNFTQASKKLFITQQGLSRSIKNLEAELGVLLFERTGKGVKPTRYGEQLHKTFCEASDGIQAIFKVAEELRKENPNLEIEN